MTGAFGEASERLHPTQPKYSLHTAYIQPSYSLHTAYIQPAEEQRAKDREQKRIGNHREVSFETPHKKRKPEDSSRPPCHGQVYSQKCNKEGCTFDHHAGRCEAYRTKHPDGPPKP